MTPPARAPLQSPVWQACRPTAWLVAGLALIVGLRLTGWWVCRVWEPELPAAREIAKGLAWDVALVALVFAWGRATLALPRLRWLVLGPALVAGLAVTVRWLDLAHCFLARAHWSVDAFQYLDTGFAGSLADVRMILALAALAATALGMATAVLRDAGKVRTSLGKARPAWLALPLLLAIGPAAWAIRDGVKFPAHLDDVRLTPEVHFALQAHKALQAPPVAQPTPRLPEDTFARFQRWGLIPPDKKPDADFPLLHDRHDDRPFPFPKRADRLTDRPDVVVTFLESTNALFVHPLSGRYQGLMPELSGLAGRMTSLDGFHNTSAPTISALVTAMCGIHPSTHPRDLRPGQTVDGQAAYTCLADVLRQQGYRTVFVQAASKTVTSKEYFLRTHGFDEVWGREELGPKFAGRHQGPWGPHDAELVEFTEEAIRRLDKKRAQDGRPYLLVMLTLDAHEPGMSDPACELPPNLPDVPDTPAARKLLAGYHCMDKALGRLGRFLLAPERAGRTVWLMTADHAAFADLVPPEIYPNPDERRHSARVPFLLHDPLHDLPKRWPVLAGTRDVAPTLLHVLGVVQGAHSMTGWSAFGTRQDFPLLVGRVGERLAFARTPDQSVELPVGHLRTKCQRGDELLKTPAGPLSACDLATWLDWQDGLWAARKLFPAALYRGADRVDPDTLLRRQDHEQAGVH